MSSPWKYNSWMRVRLAEYLHEHNIKPQQVQDFYPTPGTISTCMFYIGIDPLQ